MEQLLVTTICSANLNPLLEISKLTAKQDCHILMSRLDTIGKDCTLTVHIEGNWSAIAKVETAINNLARSLSIEVIYKRTQKEKETGQRLPYTVQIFCLDEPELLYEVSEFFATQEVHIVNSKTFSYTRDHTLIFELEMSVYIPAEVNIADVREQFLLFCDELNLDGVLEPQRG